MSFQPRPCQTPERAVASAVELDLAGDARPRCILELPAATEPGVFCGSCPCGLTFAVTARGEPGDSRKIAFRCWPKPVGADQRSTGAAGPPGWQSGLFRCLDAGDD